MFYLTLPSNSSLKYYPDNTLTQFTTQLAQPIKLQGQWEVGLAEIQYPHSWHNMNEGWIKIQSHKDLPIEYPIPSGQYNTPEELIKTLNQLIHDSHAYTWTKEMTVIMASVTFTYHSVTQKVTIKVPTETTLEVSHDLMKMLGFTQDKFRSGTFTGVRVIDVNQGFHSLYVYTNIIEPRFVGDAEAPLLRIVPIEGKSGQTLLKTYENVHYLSILQKSFSSIEVYIRKDTGEPVPFELGKVVITLHFREKTPYF